MNIYFAFHCSIEAFTFNGSSTFWIFLFM